VLAVGWLNATFVALTMHGWWWPGRQLVVVLPAAVLAVAWWAGGDTTARRWLVGGMLAGVAIAGWLWVELVTGRLRLVVDFETTTMPVVRALRLVLPDLRADPAGTQLLVAVWITVLVALAGWGWRRAARPAAAPLAGPVLSLRPEKRGNPWARPSA
jgi:hypothetical protein